VVHHPHEQEAALAHLSRFAQEKVAAVPFTVNVASGSPAPQILSYAEREKVDLIVMGTHGRTGLRHVMQGSVAEAVVRHGPCLVLTITKSVELPREAAAPSAPGPGEATAAGQRADRCRVCALPSEEIVCATCKARIEAEAFYRSVFKGIVNAHSGRT
jgi:K+-sensing histidine kinase KdpD